MVILPDLKSGPKKKTHPRKLPKSAQNRLKQGKKHTHLNKLTNTIGVSDVEFCAESNGTIPGAENWCNKKTRPKN